MPRIRGPGRLTQNERPSPSLVDARAVSYPETADALHPVLLVVFGSLALPGTFRIRRWAAHGPTRKPEGGPALPGRGLCCPSAGRRLHLVAVVDHDTADAAGRGLDLWIAERIAHDPPGSLGTTNPSLSNATGSKKAPMLGAFSLVSLRTQGSSSALPLARWPQAAQRCCPRH